MIEMTRPLVGTIHPDDMLEIREGVEAAQRAVDYLHAEGARIEVPTPWRWWEYGTPIQMMLNQYKEHITDIEVLDVGSGWSALGPTLALLYGTQVTEYEPNIDYCRDRIFVNMVLANKGQKVLQVHQVGLENMPQDQFDVVSCISVLEHVNPQLERSFWTALAQRVRPNRMLYITTDCLPERGKPYTYDNLRTQNFVVDDLKERVEFLMSFGFIPLGKPDWKFNGCFVYDYTFFRCGMMKLK